MMNSIVREYIRYIMQIDIYCKLSFPINAQVMKIIDQA